jgi:hypothetical protein
MMKFQVGDRCKIVGGLTYEDGRVSLADGALVEVQVPEFMTPIELEGHIWVRTVDAQSEFTLWPEEYLVPVDQIYA